MNKFTVSMRDNEIIPLQMNSLGYLEFTFNDVTYYLLKGVLKLTGKAQGISSEFDKYMYFIDREMPNKRLKNGLAFAIKNYLNDDFTFKNDTI